MRERMGLYYDTKKNLLSVSVEWGKYLSAFLIFQ